MHILVDKHGGQEGTKMARTTRDILMLLSQGVAWMHGCMDADGLS